MTPWSSEKSGLAHAISPWSSEKSGLAHAMASGCCVSKRSASAKSNISWSDLDDLGGPTFWETSLSSKPSNNLRSACSSNAVITCNYYRRLKSLEIFEMKWYEGFMVHNYSKMNVFSVFNIIQSMDLPRLHVYIQYTFELTFQIASKVQTIEGNQIPIPCCNRSWKVLKQTHGLEEQSAIPLWLRTSPGKWSRPRWIWWRRV